MNEKKKKTFSNEKVLTQLIEPRLNVENEMISLKRLKHEIIVKIKKRKR